MVEGSSSTGANVGSQMSPNTTIAIISSLFILILLYPWIIFVTVVSFIVGFIGLEHVDKFIKTSIVTGRFGPLVQSRYTEYIDLTENSENTKNVIKEVTADPLRDFIEEDKDQEKSTILPQQLNDQPFNLQDNQNIIFENDVGLQSTLIIPARLSSSSRSSPEKNKPLFDSPKRSLSAASSRRVSEDIPGSSTTANNLIAPFAVVGGISGIYTQQQQQHQRRESSNKTPSPSRSSNAGSTPSPSITLNPEIVGTLRVDQEFRVDVRIDQSFGRLCTRIIDYYISPSWAPYETRRQLKLNFKQLLNKVAEQCDRKLLCHKLLKEGESSTVNVNAPIVKLAREKLLPLALHYLDKILTRGLAPKNGTDEEVPIMTEDSKRRLVLKIRKFCRQIFERFLTKDDKNCKLWMELCIAVLGDGVLVNVMTLGMDKLPELLEELMVRVKKSSSSGSLAGEKLIPSMKRSPSDTGSVKNENEFTDPLSEDFHEASQEPFTPLPSSPPPTPVELGETMKAENNKGSTDKIPFLLDSFLDPPYNLEKPDPIVSRWRPTIRDIVSETDLLYPLIQYMKHVGGQQSLVYLQGVLDEFPQDGDEYCRRVLELEYLPGFCRSSLFLETMGLSRVEMALEVGTDPSSPMRRHSSSTNNSGGHARSASYGGPSSSFREFLKIEQGIVDGLPLTESSQQNTSASSSSSDHSSERSTTGSVGGGSGSGTGSASLPVAGEIQPSLAFKRRPHLEMYIAKFIKSTSKTWKQYYDPLAEQHDLAKRIGTEAKSYEEWSHPEVNSRVKIECSTAEIYDSLIDLVTSLMRSSSVASPFFSGLAVFLKPYMMPIFNEQLDKNLTEVLSEDLLVTVVDLIADVYEEQSDDTTDNDNNSTNIPSSSKDNEYGNFSSFNTLSSNSTSPNCPSSLPSHNTNNTSEEESHEYHNSSCTTCDPSFKSTIKSFLANILECVMLKLIDLDYFVKCFSRNKEFIFLFFVDLLDVLVEELVEK